MTLLRALSRQILRTFFKSWQCQCADFFLPPPVIADSMIPVGIVRTAAPALAGYAAASSAHRRSAVGATTG
ncbi:hypothetical protein KCMC57_up04210 [Kitasatospora sp. CMC57]|uniref:Uncharacterized protein n=1 Tax=Kitasatospora sp. CMC57 TaxID=3231513 RepID=A0AB33JL46_9ACTN